MASASSPRGKRLNAAAVSRKRLAVLNAEIHNVVTAMKQRPIWSGGGLREGSPNQSANTLLSDFVALREGLKANQGTSWAPPVCWR